MASGTKTAMTGDGINSQSAPEKLRHYVDRWKALDEDKKAISEEQKELMDAAKSEGFDTKIIRKVIALSKQDKNKVAEEQAVLDLYLSALGMDYDENDSNMV